MKKTVALFLVVVFLCSLPKPVYANGPLKKLQRGIINIATGWVELPKQFITETNERGNMGGFVFVGPLKGITFAVARTLGGVYDVVTFLIPLPENYEPLIKPEFVMDKM